MQRRPEGEGNFVDALPQTLGGCKGKIHNRAFIHFRGTANLQPGRDSENLAN
jgi:hypothetical protein